MKSLVPETLRGLIEFTVLLITNGNTRIRKQLLSSNIQENIAQVALACPGAMNTRADPSSGLDILLPLYLAFHRAIIYLWSFDTDDSVIRSSHDTVLAELISTAHRWSISRSSRDTGPEQLFEHAVNLLRKYVYCN